MTEVEITVYISENGNDSNEGTSESPLWSVAAALDRIRGKSYESARFIITGSITEPSAPNAMINITGRNLPVLYLRGGSSENPAILNAKGLGKRVMFISDGNTVCLEKNIVVCGGITRHSGGSGVTINGGTLIMRGGEISDNDAGYGMGGGVYVGKNSEFTMESGLITRNKTQMSGGGVFPDEGGKFTMQGGVISKNKAFISGGGVFVGVGSQFVLRDGVINDNKTGGEKAMLIAGVEIPCGQGGGVLVCSGANFIMEGGKIENNRAIAVVEHDYAGSGGGVYVEAGGVFAFESGIIEKNGVMKWGGGVYNAGSFTSSPNSVIRSNIARLGGGGVHVAVKKGVFMMKGGLLMNNYTGGRGGAVNVAEGGSLTVERGIIVKNNAGEMGNGLAIKGMATIDGGVIVEKFEFMRDDDVKANAPPEKQQYIIFVDEAGKLTLQSGEVDGKVAMAKGGTMEDLREKKDDKSEEL